MIKFECNQDNVAVAQFEGNVETLTAELMVEVSIIYGCLKMKNEQAASTFKKLMTIGMLDEDGRKLVFSDEIAKALFKNENYISVAYENNRGVDDDLDSFLTKIMKEGRDGESQ